MHDDVDGGEHQQPLRRACLPLPPLVPLRGRQPQDDHREGEKQHPDAVAGAAEGRDLLSGRVERESVGRALLGGRDAGHD
jgi:hypothetical protein